MPMRMNNLALLASVSIGGLLVAFPASAQTLTGQVSSSEEGNMEGVLVTAKKDGHFDCEVIRQTL